MLDTVFPCRAHRLQFHWRIPIRRSGYRPPIGSKTNADKVRAVSRSAQLADVEFSLPAHRGRCRVTDVRVVRPNHSFRVWSAVTYQELKGIEHVPVAQVPGLARAFVHDAIILFRSEERRVGKECRSRW